MNDRFRDLLGPLFLRIGLGILAIMEPWPQALESRRSDFLVETLHLPGPSVLGHDIKIGKFGRGILLVIACRPGAGTFRALAMLGDILASNVPLGNRSAWAFQWQSFWMALTLLVLGVGCQFLSGCLSSRVGRATLRINLRSAETFTPDHGHELF